jgi:hypothetical protein
VIRALILLPLLLTGCTYISVRQPDGSSVTFVSTKNIKVDELKLGNGRTLRGLNSDASSVVEATGNAAGSLGLPSLLAK